MPHDVTRRAFLRLMGFGSVAVAISACQPASTPAGSNTSPSGGNSTSQPAGTPEPLNLPIVSQPLTLSYWAPMSTNVAPTMKSFGEIACYVELEKRTGVHLEFQ